MYDHWHKCPKYGKIKIKMGTGKHIYSQRGNEMDKLIIAFAMVIIGGVAIWYVFGGIVMELMATLMTVL